jgi:hypothetical protein
MRTSACRRPLWLGALTVLSALVPATAARAEGWGTIQGQVVFDGPAPEREKVAVTKDQEHCLSKGPLFSDVLIVNAKNKGVKNTVVWLLHASDPKKPLPIHPQYAKGSLPAVSIDQPCCQFVPHVVALRQGQDLILKNGAPVAHNTNVYVDRGPSFNVILPPGGEKKLAAEDITVFPARFMVKCNIHPWMSAYGWAFNHPYFAVTDDDGKFTIKNAPAGDWRIVLWHETKGWVKGDRRGTPVVVRDGQTTDLGAIPLTPSKD